MCALSFGGVFHVRMGYYNNRPVPDESKAVANL